MTLKSNFFPALSRVMGPLFVVAVLMVFGVVEVRAAATIKTWNGGGGSGIWSNAANWSGTNILTTEVANFAGTNQLITTNNFLTNTFTLGGLTFATNAGNFVVNGNQILLNGNIDNNSTNGAFVTINTDIALTGKTPQVNANGTSVILINGNISESGGAYGLQIGNAAGDSGTVILAGSNSFTGAITYKNTTNAVLRIANSFALGTAAGGVTVSAGNALQLSNNINVGAEGLNLSGSGVGGTGALRNIHGTNSFAGAITNLAAATIEADANTSLTLSGINTGNFAKTFDGAGNITASGIISGSGGVTKTGTGTLTLSAANTFTGNLTNSAGTVRATSNAGALGAGNVTLSGGNLELANDTGLNFGDPVLVTSGTTITSDRLNAGAGVTHTLGLLTNGAQTINIAKGANVTSGTAGITFGNVVLNATGATYNAGAGTLLTLGGITGNTFGFTVGGDGNTTISGVIATTTGTVSKTGNGTLTMGSGANTYGGVTTVGGGVLQVTNVANAGANSSLGTNGTIILNNGGVLDYAGTTNSSMNRGINLTSGNGGMGVSNSAVALTLSGVISNTGTFVKTGVGTLILTASNTYSGGTTVNEGTLAIGTTSDRLLDSGALTINGSTAVFSIGALNETIGAVTLTDGSITGTTGVLTGSSYTVQNGSISAILAGTGVTLTKSGAGTVTLTGSNSYTGQTTISGGTLRVGAGADAGYIASSTAITNNGALVYNVGAGNRTNSAIISGTGTFTHSGTGTITLTGSNTYTGATTIGSTGTLRIGAGTDAGSIGSTASIANSGRLVYDVAAGNRTLGALISGSGSFVQNGSGTITLTGSNSYTGTTTIANGTLQIGAGTDAGSIANSTAITNNGALVYNVGAGNRTNSAIISGTGTFTQLGTGTITLSGSNSYSGATFINGGTLAFGSTAALTNSSGINLGNGTFLEYTGAAAAFNRNISVTNGTGTIRNTGAGTLTLSGALSKNGTTLRFNSGTFNITGVISGASANSDLVVDAATVTLSNTNTYNGPTFIRNAGILNAAVVGAMPTNTRSALIMDDTGSGNSIFNVTASQQIASLTGAASSTNTIATNTTLTIGTTATNTTFAGAISGGGGLVKDGASTQTLTGANTYSGGTLVSAGVLAGNAFGLQGNITNNATVAFTQSSSGTYAGTMSGTGAMTKNGTGLLTLTSSNSFSGGTTVREGELHVNSAGGLGTGIVSLTGTNPVSLAALHYSNTVSPLTIGALTLNGNAEIALQALASVASTGALNINSTNNFIAIGGSNWNLGTNTLVSGTSLTINGGASILLTGTTLNNGTLGLGSTTNIGRSSFTFGSNATSFYLTTAGVAFDVLWSGAQNNLWNTNATNWQQTTNGLNPSGTNIAFATDDNVYFGNTATNAPITVSAGGVQAAEMYVTNTGGTVAFSGASLAGHNLFKSGSGNLTISNTLQLIGDDAAGPNVGVFSNSGSGNVTLAGAFTEGSLVQNGAGTVTLSASNSFGGTTTVNAGVLNLNSATGSALGSTTSVSVSTGATLLVAQNNQVNNSATVSLTGGTIRTASGVSETFGNLSVTGSGFLDFGTTSYANQNTINFGTYTPSALLTIDNFNFGSTLTFKSDLSSTINNLSYFSFSNGGIASSSWDSGSSTFTITAIPEPSTYLAAAGLIALMLWPSRRKILNFARRAIS